MKNVVRDSRRSDDTGLLDSERLFYAVYICTYEFLRLLRTRAEQNQCVVD